MFFPIASTCMVRYMYSLSSDVLFKKACAALRSLPKLQWTCWPEDVDHSVGYRGTSLIRNHPPN